ncbi:hypothetical protein AB1Y20_005514 [Prymnesium parvum]|uniref:Polycystin cation channel PKD1/PKD2 domain-containing protein n=1 Tax=Prymnesium parvum TaxID=97485 RepID=A0AB34J4J3_PRYPA
MPVSKNGMHDGAVWTNSQETFRLKRQPLLTVYVCASDQNYRSPDRLLRFYFDENTTFHGIHKQAAHAICQPIADVILTDENGAIWPDQRLVKDEIRSNQPDPILRLSPTPTDASTTSEDSTVKEVVVTRIEDDGAVKGARPPKRRELALHTAFVLCLLVELVTSFNTRTLYELRGPVLSALTESPILPVDTSSKTYINIRSYNEVLQWIEGPLIATLTESSAAPTGSIMSQNRMVGGLRFEVWRRPYAGTFLSNWGSNNSETPSAAANQSIRGDFGLYSNGFDQERELARIVEREDELISYVSRDVLPEILNISRDNVSEPTSVPQITQDALKQAAFWMRYELIKGTFISPDQRTSDSTEPAYVWFSVDHVRVSFMLYNHNLNVYLWCDMHMELNDAGLVTSSHRFDAFRMYVPWSDADFFRSPASAVLFFNLVGFFVLVLMRMHSESIAVRKIKHQTGSYWPYLLSIYSCLEIVNLVCCWLYLLLNIIVFFISERKNFDVHSLTYRDLSRVADLSAATMGVRGISVITAAFTYFKFLVLMPKASTWYLTGTTLSRSGKDLKCNFFVITMYLGAWGIWANQTFGVQSGDFASWWVSFISLIKLLSGDPRVARSFLRDTTNEYISFYFFYFFLFYFNFILVLIPLILAILRDAYAVRNDQLRDLQESIKQQQEILDREKEAIAARRRRAMR